MCKKIVSDSQIVLVFHFEIKKMVFTSDNSFGLVVFKPMGLLFY